MVGNLVFYNLNNTEYEPNINILFVSFYRKDARCSLRKCYHFYRACSFLSLHHNLQQYSDEMRISVTYFFQLLQIHQHALPHYRN